MKHEVSINDLLEIEAYIDSLKEKLKSLRSKLEGQAAAVTDQDDTIYEGLKAQLKAYSFKASLTNKSRTV